MATKSNKQNDKDSDVFDKTNVTRIKATDEKPAIKTKIKLVKAKKVVTDKKTSGILSKLARPFVLIGRYFKGAWSELQLVHWPNRRATWGLTGAVLLFSAFFVVLILLLDALFKYLFELILS